MAQDHGLVEDEAVVLGRGGPDTRIKRRSRSPASGLPWGAFDAPFFVCGQDRRPPCRSQETHGQTSLRLLRAWDVISLTDKKSVFRHLHGQ
jgi:hypothetical protein